MQESLTQNWMVITFHRDYCNDWSLPFSLLPTLQVHTAAKIYRVDLAWLWVLCWHHPYFPVTMQLCVHMENFFPKAVPSAKVCAFNHNAKSPPDPWAIYHLQGCPPVCSSYNSNPWKTTWDHEIARWSWLFLNTHSWDHTTVDGTLRYSLVLETLESSSCRN